MMHQAVHSSRWGSARLFIVLASSFAWVVAFLRIAAAPADVFMVDVLVDDALYFAVPARHWWSGHGFSFDGLEQTNGVQPLWAIVVLALSGVFEGPFAVPRAMVALSGACWGLAAVLLFNWLRPLSWPAALFAASGFAWCGVHGRLAMQGMENGVHALFGMLFLLAGRRYLVGNGRVRDAFVLGGSVAAFGICRTEAALVAPFVAISIVTGVVCPSLGVRARLGRAAVFAALPLLAVGGCAAVNFAWFGDWMPISGRVKAFYESVWGGNQHRGGVLGSALWHVKHVANLALSPLREDLVKALVDVLPLKLRAIRTAVWIVLGLLLTSGAIRLRRSGWWPPLGIHARIVGVFGAYSVVHLLLVGLALPHFTEYGTWYFASEVTVLWLIIGYVVAAGSHAVQYMVLALAMVLALVGAVLGGHLEADPRTRRMWEGGAWLSTNVPANAVVGALSSGLAAWRAEDLHVVNLDGLINNRRYLDDVLVPERLESYVDQRRISWFADYQRCEGWRDGVAWRGRIPAERLQPWLYLRTDTKHSYAIWQILPRGESFSPLGQPDTRPRDRYVELAVAADVYGRFPVVSARDLRARLEGHPDHVVARSMVMPDGELLHVLVPKSQLAELGLTESTVRPARRTELEPIPGVRLLGYELSGGRLGDIHHRAATLFWQRTRDVDAKAELTVTLARMDGTILQEHGVGNCHGTLAIPEWPNNSVMTETVVLRVTDGGDCIIALNNGRERFPMDN